MSDIPEDIRATAEKCADAIGAELGRLLMADELAPTAGILPQFIAESILAERNAQKERDAQIVEQDAEEREALSYQQGGAKVKARALSAQAFALKKIAARIRSPDKAENHP